MQQMLIILIALSAMAFAIMLREKRKVREFIRWYKQNIAIYDIFYPVLEKAVKEKCEFFESSSINFIENVEAEPIIIRVDRYMIMVWRKTKVAGAVYELERMFNELADYSEEISDIIKDFEELEENKKDIFNKLYYIRLLILNLPQS